MPSKKKKYNARFPPARVKKIMQTDEDVGKVAAAVPVIISRALELFIESLIRKTSETTQSKNAKTLTATHIKQTIHSERKFDFLRDLVVTVPDHQAEDETEPSTNHKRSYAPRQRKEKDKNSKRRKKKTSSESSEAEEEEDDESTETDEECNNDPTHLYEASTSKVTPHPAGLPTSPSQPMALPNQLATPYPYLPGYGSNHQNIDSDIAQPINLCTKEEPNNLNTSDQGQSVSREQGQSFPHMPPNLSPVGTSVRDPPSLPPSGLHPFKAVPGTSAMLGATGNLASLASFMPAVPVTQEDDDYDT
ncbi:dr1-associated corepressor-like [Mizuhopecten yessoensis]|uniref:Dr1-associated corepressor n=1 Tax=Mizuhopecten yessoensis TaxID=6573 RepID=A0A210QUA1_MIZYE|nr:dr1-associated corepressor-like [Mizuhopecten yessoensis]OWF52317.1 Dr1-associated corepressor [Mizuhopecten yessoensis]